MRSYYSGPPPGQPSGRQVAPPPIAEIIADGELHRMRWRDDILVSRWPALFDRQQPVPLAVGIREMIADHLALSRSARRRLGRALARWCGRDPYLEALAAPGAVRVDLALEAVEPVSAEHPEYALRQLEGGRLRRKPGISRVNAAQPILRLKVAS